MHTQKIDIKLRPSQQFIALMVLVEVGSLAIMLSLPLFWWIKLLGMAVVMIYAGRIFWHHGLLRGANVITGLSYRSEGWLVQTRSGVFAAELGGESTLTTCLCVLRFKLAHRRPKVSCVVFRDALGPEDYRQFLVRLRTAKTGVSVPH